VGYSGDGGAATSATFQNPCGIALDGSGGIYIADTGNDAIRKVSGSTISTVAGNGSSGFSGDDAAAKDAMLFVPLGMVVDSSGNLYFADSFNHRIRKIATDGKISSIVGGSPGYLGDGGPAIDARLSAPRDLALDAGGNLYIADTFNHSIRKVAPDGTITTVAGGNTRGFYGDGGPATNARLNYPQGVAVDGSGNIYIADTANNRIRMVTENGIIATIAGSGSFGQGGDGGPAKNAQLRFPSGIIADASGNVWITDDQNSRVRKLTRDAAPENAAPSIGRVITSSMFGGSTDIAAGAWVEIYGSNLAPDSRQWTAADFDGDSAPMSLDGVTVTVGGVHAYVAYISPNQVNVLIPSNAGLGEQPVQVTRGTSASPPFTVTVKAIEPGLLAPSSLNLSGAQYAAALLPDQVTYVMPTGESGRPARPGETITLYGNGFGSVTPNVKAGEIVRQASVLDLPVHFYFGETQATVTFAGLAPGAMGLYRFDVVTPALQAGDAVPLTFTLDGVKGKQTLFTVVRD